MKHDGLHMQLRFFPSEGEGELLKANDFKATYDAFRSEFRVIIIRYVIKYILPVVVLRRLVENSHMNVDILDARNNQNPDVFVVQGECSLLSVAVDRIDVELVSVVVFTRLLFG